MASFLGRVKGEGETEKYTHWLPPTLGPTKAGIVLSTGTEPETFQSQGQHSNH